MGIPRQLCVQQIFRLVFVAVRQRGVVRQRRSSAHTIGTHRATTGQRITASEPALWHLFRRVQPGRHDCSRVQALVSYTFSTTRTVL